MRLGRVARAFLFPNTVIFILFAAAAQAASAADEQLTPVDDVDLARYAGRWHEVARIPNRFQKKCVRATTADYVLRNDGRLDVINRCLTKDGDIDEASGVAKIVDKESNAKLKVSFVRVLGLQLFWGAYWVIGLDEDYQWAIVGHPKRKFGWILSRTPTLDENTLDEAFAILKSKGYEQADFVLSKP